MLIASVAAPSSDHRPPPLTELQRRVLGASLNIMR